MFPTASTDVIKLSLTLKMTNAQVVETSATVNNQPCSRDNVHPDDHIQYSTYKMTSNGVQTFHNNLILMYQQFVKDRLK